ncbi:hypothetical protein [Parachlamydia sp.]|uniref:hypothetical protein n=1 Tax=Parachlamydia sp. TaxID=2052048 RepID=UPI003D0CEB02
MVDRIFIDNGLLNTLCKDTKGNLWNSFLDTMNSRGFSLEDRRNCFATDIFLFLEFIGLGKILEKTSSTLLPTIKSSIIDLFRQTKSVEITDINKVLDNAFVQCFSACKALPEINPQALLTQHKDHLSHFPGEGAKFLDRIISDSYLENLQNHPQDMHDSISRHLAWQLLTTILRTIFNEVSISSQPDLVLRLFEPMMASIHHAVLSYGVQLNFFRLAEAMYLSTIRQYEKKLTQPDVIWLQEYRQKHQTRKRGDLADCIYLDRAILGYIEVENGELRQSPITVLTMDDSTDVFNRLKLFRNVLEKLQSEVKDWRLNPVYSCKVICLEQHLLYKETVEHAIQPTSSL